MRRFLAISFVQRGLMFAVYLVATMVLARLLTPAEIGIFSMTAAFTGILAAVREFGMSEYILQERELDRGKVRAVYGVAIVMGIAVGAVVFVMGPLLASVYGEPTVRDIAFVLCLNFVLLPFATPSMALLFREMQLSKVWAIQTTTVVVQYIISVYLAWRGMGPISLAWGTVASSVASVVLANVLRPAELHLLPTLAGSRTAWHYGFKYSLASSIEVAAKNVHEFVLPRAFGFAALGLYSRALGLIELFNQNFKGAISRVLFPAFAKDMRQDKGDLNAQYGKAASLFTVIAWPFFVCVALLSREIILVLFGDQWLAAAPLLSLLCIAATLQSAQAFAAEVLGARGDVGAKLKITGITGPVWLGLCLLGAAWNVEAVALLYAGPAAVSLWLHMRRLAFLIGFGFGDLVRSTYGSAVVALAASAATFSARHFATQAGVHSLLVLAVSGTVAAVAWLIAALVVRHPILDEVRHLNAWLQKARGR